MLLSEWISKQVPLRGAIQRLATESGLNYTTVFNAAHGELLKTYAAAKSISDATKGEVSIEELCEAPKPEAKPKRRRTA